MTRFILMIVGALVLGVLIGNQLPGNRNTPAIPTQATARPVSGAPDSYQEMLAVKEAEIARLTDRNVELDALVQHYSEIAEDPEPELAVEAVTEPVLVDESPEEVVEERPARRGRESWGSPEERERMMTAMREGMVDRWAEEWDKASPESQERISAIATLQQELMDTGMAMRDAESDEERALIRDEMEVTRDLLRETVNEEQNAQLAKVARDAGLGDDEAIARFVEQTRTVLSSPVFQSGGRGGPSGFRGPGRGGR